MSWKDRIFVGLAILVAVALVAALAVRMGSCLAALPVAGSFVFLGLSCKAGNCEP